MLVLAYLVVPMKRQARLRGPGLIVVSIKWQTRRGGPDLISGVDQRQARLHGPGIILILHETKG